MIQSRDTLTTFGIGCLALALLLLAPATAEASGRVFVQSMKANKNAGLPYGYDVKVDAGWSDVGGYRPVRIEITPHEPTEARRIFTVELRIRCRDIRYRGGDRTMVVTQDIVIPPAPAGSQPPATTATISVPQLDLWDTLSADFWEDGVHRPRLEIPRRSLGNGTFYPNQLSGEAIVLLVDSRRSTPGSFPNMRNNGRRGGVVESDTVTIPPEQLPTRWIDLTSIDAVCLSLDDLERLVKEHPQRWQAVREWTAAGGNLFVTDVATSKRLNPRTRVFLADWQELRRLEKLLDVRTGSAGADMPLWQSKGQTKTREFHLGQVTALGNGNPVDRQLRVLQRGGMFDSGMADLDRLKWHRRTGVSLDWVNNEFWEFIIPGVGKVPVTMFQVLITLFVIGIGPLNYVFLRRRGKLHLLILTVPACALVVTLGLFGYGLIADGLGVRVRARSYTEIDQRRGEAVCWSRLCYYAGLAPSQGLTFSGDVAVLPVDGGIEESGGQTRQVAWSDDRDQQHLSSGWLRSRQLTQFLTMRSRRTKARLDITPGGDGSMGLKVENQLGTAIRYVIVCDADNEHYATESLPEGEARTLKAGVPGEIFDRMTQAFRDNAPQLPPGVGAWDMRSGSRRYYFRYSDGDMPQFETSRLEAGLSAASGQIVAAKLQPRSYLAIVEKSPEVEYGTPSARQEASFHVVRGRW